jgi:hypothetical protein
VVAACTYLEIDKTSSLPRTQLQKFLASPVIIGPVLETLYIMYLDVRVRPKQDGLLSTPFACEHLWFTSPKRLLVLGDPLSASSRQPVL